MNILVVGTGGIGGYLLKILNHTVNGAKITVVDPDTVEEKNTKNQLFDMSDIGKYKVFAAMQRFQNVNLGITARIQVLLNKIIQSINSKKKNALPLSHIVTMGISDLLIITVTDNIPSRLAVAELFAHLSMLIGKDVTGLKWIDAGVFQTEVEDVPRYGGQVHVIRDMEHVRSLARTLAKLYKDEKKIVTPNCLVIPAFVHMQAANLAAIKVEQIMNARKPTQSSLEVFTIDPVTGSINLSKGG